MNSFSLFKNAKNPNESAVYALYSVGAILFLGISIFTILRTVTQTALLPQVPPLVYAVVAAYIVPQLIIAYGLYRCRKWVSTVFVVHVLISLVTFFIVMPYFQMQAQIQQSLISSSMYWALLLFTFTTRSYCSGKYFHVVAVPVYAVALLFLVASRVYLQIY